MSKPALKIGTDIEIGFTNNSGTQIVAENLINFSEDRGKNLLANFDFDGHQHIMEAKTGIGDRCPIAHTQRIKNLILNLSRRINYFDKKVNVKIVAGSMIADDSMGGHIHFNSQKLKAKVYANHFDFFLAIPILMMATKKTFTLRPRNSDDYSRYGTLSDIRIPNAHKGFEYRTLPSFLLSESLTKSILCLAYVVADAIYNGNKELLKFSDLPLKAEDAYYAGDRLFFSQYIDCMFKEIKKMRLYPTYAVYIASLFGLIKVSIIKGSQFNWKEKNCILPRWNITEDIIKGKNSIVFDKNNKKLVKLLKQFEGQKFDRTIKFYRLPKFVRSNFIVYPQIPCGAYQWGSYNKSSNKFELEIGLADIMFSTNSTIKETIKLIDKLFRKIKVKVTSPEFKVNKKTNKNYLTTSNFPPNIFF